MLPHVPGLASKAGQVVPCMGACSRSIKSMWHLLTELDSRLNKTCRFIVLIQVENAGHRISGPMKLESVGGILLRNELHCLPAFIH
jgi:hypothetical protein